MNDGICSVESCARPVKARSWCGMHYRRWQRTGDPLVTPNRRPSDIPFTQWFWGQFAPDGDCLIWTGGRLDDWGYGRIRVPWQTAKMRTHRVAWELTYGPVAPDLVICHTCDRPACGNIDHLYLGTHLTNSEDKFSRGRFVPARGERNGKVRLTEGEVRAIRGLVRQGIRHRDVAEKFGVSKSAVGHIMSGRTWRHVR